MKTPKKFLSRKQSQLFRSLIATAFIANGFFPFVAPAFAEGTTAGTQINNRATATYEDPNQLGTTINATSNTVTVTVAEVAGINVTTSGVPTDNTPATPISVGDTLTYTFAITNVGNDPTSFRIPNLATTTGPAVVSGNLSYSANGTNYNPITGSELITTDIILPGQSVFVRVPVAVQAGANNNDIITVQLGDTPGNAQNVLRVNNGGDVYTVDNANGAVIGEIDGVPANGTREASARQTSTVGGITRNLALATLLKTIPTGGYKDKDGVTPLTPGDISDDTVTYNLSLRVEGNDVTGLGITPNPLAGYAGIRVDGDNTKNYILVSDVIPTGTKLLAAPTAPDATWIPVYSTAVVGNVKPQDAAVAWSTITPANPAAFAAVTRVGFVKETTPAGPANIPAAVGEISPGTTVNGFSFKLGITGTATGTPPTLSINNIAQVVGQTPNGGLPVYDESGDQNPSNYNGAVGSMTPGVTSADGVLPTNAAAVTDSITNGVADPAAQGVDSSNNNTGTGPGGEDNVLVIGPTVATSVLNGPLNAPTATGPDGTTATDFTNKSSFIPPNTNPGSLLTNIPRVGFSNTVQNTGTNIGTITLEPIVPVKAADLPNGTTVTITYNGASAVYTYVLNGAGDSAIGSFTPPPTQISIPDVPAGASVGYGVEVKLPDSTKLSTDTLPDYPGDTEWGYPVPIRATIGTGPNAPFNVTIDRVYTGYLQLVKVSRILPGTGTAVAGTQGNFESTPAYTNPSTSVVIDPNSSVPDEPRRPTPGNIIEYQIRYRNISNPQAGTGNVILGATKVVITEDGTVSPNNWALDNDVPNTPGFGIIDTSNITNPQASDSNSGTIQFFPSVNQSGTTAATDVTRYVNTVNGTVAPQSGGTFTFQRRVN